MEAQAQQEHKTIGERISTLVAIASKLPEVRELVLVKLENNDQRQLYISLEDDVLYLDRRSMSFVKVGRRIGGRLGAKTLAFAAIGSLPVIGQIIYCMYDHSGYYEYPTW